MVQAHLMSWVIRCRRKLAISEATFYDWKKQYAGMGIAELAELRQLREENTKLKRLVADLSLDKHVLQEIVAKSCEASCSTAAHTVGAAGLSDERTSGSGADGDEPQFRPVSQR